MLISGCTWNSKKALVKMVTDLEIAPLAEGVETDAEGTTCRQLGFQLAQGFYYGKPVPARSVAPPACPMTM